MRSQLTAILILCFLTSACTHTPPEKRSSEAEIQQHIAGSWTLDERSDIDGFRGLEISTDGTITSIKLDSTRQLVGTWLLDGRMLVVRPANPNIVLLPDGNTANLDEQSYYPVIFASEHELVCGLGISVAGRMRFKR
jgi:hypothetical protein